jgi:hypothetical protein
VNGGLYIKGEKIVYQYTQKQRQSGGRSRAASARRDPLGRMMPKVGELRPDPDHGRIGGQVRAASARRDTLGRFQ